MQFTQQTSGAQRGRAQRERERPFEGLIWRGNMGINERENQTKDTEVKSEIVRGNQILKERCRKIKKEREGLSGWLGDGCVCACWWNMCVCICALCGKAIAQTN